MDSQRNTINNNNTSIISQSSRKDFNKQKSLNNTSMISTGSNKFKRLRRKETYIDIQREKLGLGTSMIEVGKTIMKLSKADRSFKDDRMNKSINKDKDPRKIWKKSQTMSFRRYKVHFDDENILDNINDSKMDINELNNENEEDEERKKKEDEERKKKEDEERKKKEE